MLLLRDRMAGALLGAAAGERLAGGMAGTEALLQTAESWARWQRVELEMSENGSQSVSAAWRVMAALPVALFYWGDRGQQERQLRQLSVRWQLSPALERGILAAGRMLDGETSMSEIWKGEETGTIVRSALEKGWSLDATLQALGDRDRESTAVAIAFYCVLDTPEDFFLSAMRSRRSPHPQLSTALAGALSGYRNGITAIPVPWELAVEGRDRLRLAGDRLYVAWSGVYDVADAPLWEGTVVGGAGSFRSRF